ncbi:ABC transporter permease [Corynebacterium aquatimens]|uniref:Peptide/nickel transport system permease protein n=1 Tax=Corynebacterium aquatimens TaxID=1190508 RepID=A0A931E1L8_9CORY|nr:ABC transporter permease [Corynebacterium aquatimens]MBG6122106.1 peptide/nickel transport system permease protein [Corynebacterium aquatimens]WJY65353.1 Glutathione transport system permease protein GsiD [Corynebacterium aquatimens]
MKFPRSGGWIGLGLVLLLLVTALVSLVWTPHDPLQAEPSIRLNAFDPAHILGTDQYGRDVLSRIMVGARLTLLVAVASVSISALIGVPLGVWAGMRRGWVEAIIMRISDVVLAFPALLLAIVFTAVFGASTWIVVLAIGIAGIPGFARVSRVATLQVMSQDYVLSARISRVPGILIAWQHVLPNILAVLIVQISVSLALAILAEAGLSFLGLGTPAPYASWGRMLQSSQPYLATAPYLALWPGLSIALTVMGFNMLGDGLRDALNPREAKR